MNLKDKHPLVIHELWYWGHNYQENIKEIQKIQDFSRCRVVIAILKIWEYAFADLHNPSQTQRNEKLQASRQDFLDYSELYLHFFIPSLDINIKFV